MRRATLFAWKIPLEAGVVLGGLQLKTRRGLLVRLTASEREGWGEIAPLTGFSQESLADAQNETLNWLKAWCDGKKMSERHLPSVAFGLSCALAELTGELPEEGCYQKALLSTGDPGALLLRLQQQAEPLAKIKVGLHEPESEGMMVSLLLKRLPQLTLRLDANRRWDLAQARRFAGFITPAQRRRIAFLEEPCHDQRQARDFARETGIAIAWDESAREAGFRLQAEPYVRAVVIKPMLTGSLAQVAALVVLAEKAGMQAVISASLESSLGLTQLARIAHWLTPGVTPGLDTLDLLAYQQVRGWPGSVLPLISPQMLEVVWQS